MNPYIVISLGGSIIIPDEVDIKFLKAFRSLILKHTRSYNFIIVTGGGKTARTYTKAALKLRKLSREEQDWLGILATRLNGSLVQAMFGKKAFKELLLTPKKRVNFKEPIAVGAGAAPEGSSDYDAALLANTYHAKMIINMSNTDYIFTKNPKLKGARPLKELSWKTLQGIVGTKRVSSGHYPFDPVAVAYAKTQRMKLYAINGTDLKQLDNILKEKPFKGSLVR